MGLQQFVAELVERAGLTEHTPAIRVVEEGHQVPGQPAGQGGQNRAKTSRWPQAVMTTAKAKAPPNAPATKSATS